MAGYLFVASRDPFEDVDVTRYFTLARDIAGKGRTVTVFLVQNAVFGARRAAHDDSLSLLVRAGIEVLADEFSLRARGIPTSELKEGVRAVSLEVVIDQLAEGRKALWH